MGLIARINPNPSAEGHTMTERKLKTVRPRLEALLAQDRDPLKALVKEALGQIPAGGNDRLSGCGAG
jgi:hypothetical protein